MWMGLGLGAAVLIGVGVALLIAARGQGTEEPLPWNVGDMARLQASIMAMLGGVSITGIVIVVGLLPRTPGVTTDLDTVTMMFAIAFSFFLQSAFTLSYLPDRMIVGERLYRLYYSLASTLQYRTIVLLTCALVSFGTFLDLALTDEVLIYFITFAIVGAFVIIAVVADSLGLISFGECYLAAAAGLLLAGAFYAAMRWQGVDEPHAAVIVALTFAGVNSLSSIGTGLMPMAPRRPGLQAFLTRHARKLVALDMQTTIISMIFLWMAVARLV
jgi:hypothetical protein